MSSLNDHVKQHGPTGIPDDPLEGANVINQEIGRRVNIPGTGAFGVLIGGNSSQVADLAQVSIALSLADIAESLRLMSGRTPQRED